MSRIPFWDGELPRLQATLKRPKCRLRCCRRAVVGMDVIIDRSCGPLNPAETIKSIC
jgi:hypothetical protein